VADLHPSVKDQLGQQALDLAALALTNAAGAARPTMSSARNVALLRLRTAIESRLTDPALDPPAAAAAAGMSVRYANSLLAEQGTSLERLIMSRRLERCRRVLEDPTQRLRTIADIAYSWGFSDLSHFGRRFKREFGQTPREYRESRRNGEPNGLCPLVS
jgi:AraC-like DNA-binding protein